LFVDDCRYANCTGTNQRGLKKLYDDQIICKEEYDNKQKYLLGKVN
tara:strand:- start:551 stop:688 length:138 start_codon:yes stop_codon:yes gene_type:complete